MSSKLGNTIYTHFFVAIICFSFVLACPGGPTFCIVPHDHPEMSHTVNRVHYHEVSCNGLSQLLNPHHPHEADSPHQCCQTRSQHSYECGQSSAILNHQTDRTDSARNLMLLAALTVVRPQISDWNSLPGIPKTNNPTTLSLRTVVLLQ